MKPFYSLLSGSHATTQTCKSNARLIAPSLGSRGSREKGEVRKNWHEYSWERGWYRPGPAWERSPGNQEDHGKTTENMADADERYVPQQQAITLDFLGYLQCCGSASLSPTAGIHNGSSYGRKSAGSSVSTDYCMVDLSSISLMPCCAVI